VARRFLVARLIAWLNTLWENRPIPLWIVLGSGLGSGMGAALGLFSLQQWEWVTGLAENPGPYAGVGHLLSSVVQGFAWLAVGLPVDMINFVLCRPKYEYGCAEGYGMIYFTAYRTTDDILSNACIVSFFRGDCGRTGWIHFL